MLIYTYFILAALSATLGYMFYNNVFYLYPSIAVAAVSFILFTGEIMKKKKKVTNQTEKELEELYAKIEQKKAEISRVKLADISKSSIYDKKLEELKPEVNPVYKEVDPLFYNQSKTTFDWWRKWWQLRFNPDKVVQVNFELLNGNHKVILVKEKEGGFNYNKKFYIFDESAKRYNLSSRIYFYNFHESLTIPVVPDIPVLDIKKTIEVSKIVDVEHSLNPSTLKQFIISKIAEGIMKGQALDEAIKRLVWIASIGTIATVVLLVLFMQKTGMLNQVTGTLGI